MFTLLTAAALVAGAAAQDDAGRMVTVPQAGPDTRPRLEVIEDLSESLANDLLDLSVAVRDRDWARIARFLGESAAGTALPSVPGPLRPKVKWVSDREWTAPRWSRPAPRGCPTRCRGPRRWRAA